MATVADLIVRILGDAGVRALFGVPGGGSNLDVIAAAGRADLPFVLTATETAAAIAALAQAEVAGAPGACLTTLGPGVASVVNGVACAFLDRAPLVVFTDSYPASRAVEFTHQRLDHRALLAPVTKWSETLTAENALQALTRALREATDGPPGPVHLDCPGDVAAANTVTSDATLTAPARGRTSPDDHMRFESLLAGARRPLMIIGMGARRPDDVLAIRRLCEGGRVPALVTYKAKGVVADDAPWFAGVFTNAAIERPIVDESDLLIAVGLDPVELIPRPWIYRQPVVYCGGWPVENVHVPFAARMVTSVAAAVASIEAALAPSEWDRSDVRSHAERQRKRMAVPSAGALTAQQVVEIAARRLAPIARRVTVDAGAHMFPVTMFWPVSEANQMLISNGLSTMGFALPAAIGAAMMERTAPVVALTGDGGLLMCAGELLTAVRERLPIITIVFSDGSLSLIEIKQQARNLPPAGVSLGALDWIALGRGFGVEAWAAAGEAELERAIDAALACRGPALIEARIDRSNYGATLRAVRG